MKYKIQNDLDRGNTNGKGRKPEKTDYLFNQGGYTHENTTYSSCSVTMSMDSFPFPKAEDRPSAIAC